MAESVYVGGTFLGENQTTEELNGAIDAALSAEVPSGRANAELAGAELFSDLSGGAVRPSHALAAAADPEAIATLDFADCPPLFLATKTIGVDSGSFVVLVIGTVHSGKRIVQSAYRLYPDADTEREGGWSPTLAFRVLLERYAIRFETNGRMVLFVPVLKTPYSGEDLREIVGPLFKLDMNEEAGWGANFTARIDGETLTVAWPFAIDHVRYLADLKRNGWRP